MNINSVTNIANTAQAQESATKQSPTEFGNILKDAIDNYIENEKVSSKDTQALLTGETDDLHNVMIDMEKTGISLQLMVQIRNKVLEAYNEIMRMQF